MLGSHTPVANIPTSDLARARSFYEETLGFKPFREMDDAGVVIYSGGSGHFLLYVSPYAGTNKATAMAFEVTREEFEVEVAALRGAGVEFETFDAPGMTWDDGIAVMGEGRGAWFKDPDGNVISVMAGDMS